MSRAELRSPVLDQGIRHTNFFNGRLLFAEDLWNEGEANRAQHRQLGRAAGEGIVHGLDVSVQSSGALGSVPSLAITRGLALNRRGQAVELPRDIELALVREEEKEAADAGLFAGCLPPAGEKVTQGEGAYVLVMSPASGFSSERAPMSGLTAEGTISGCGSRFAIEGAQFRVEALHTSGTTGPAGAAGAELDVLATGGTANASKFRNVLAHLCCGTPAHGDQSIDLARTLAANEETGIIASLRRSGVVRDCDVLLAVLHWTSTGVKYVDPWAVRRLTHAGPWTGLFSLVGGRRMETARAMLLQFQQHLRELPRTITSPPVSARGYFRYLPPAGVVPIESVRYPAGVSLQFFDGVAFAPPRPIPAAQVRPLLLESLTHDPIDLSTGAQVQLYEIAENAAAQTPSGGPQPVLIFTAPTMRYVSEQPRFVDLCQAVRDAAKAYFGLLERNAFLGNETTPQGLDAQNAVRIAIAHVSAVAQSQAAFACVGAISVKTALEILKELYDAQKALVAVLLAPRSNVAGGARLIEFGTLLRTHLDVSGVAGAPSLSAALTSANRTRAVAAQNEINQLVRTWSGDVTTGTIEVRYQRSSRGRTLVLTDTGRFDYIFKITNKTNKRLDVQAAALFNPDRQSWRDASRLLNAAGNPFVSIPLEPFNAADPNNPAAVTEITVSMSVPAGAALNDAATLTLNAFVPAPINVSGNDSVALTVGNTATPDVDLLEWEVGSPSASESIATAKVGRPVTMTFTAFFRSPTANATKNVVFRVNLTSPATVPVFDVRIGTASGSPGMDPNASTATVKVSNVFQMRKDQRATIIVRLVGLPATTSPPSAGSLGQTLTFTATLEGTDGSLPITAGPFAMIVTQP